MGRIVVTEFVSLDGVMEDPGGGDFKHGGWTFEIDRGEGNAFKLEETMATDALLLGRVTYDEFAKAWPSRDGDFADKLNALPKHVVSSTLERPAWNNSSVLKGDLDADVAELKERYDGDIVVHGSSGRCRRRSPSWPGRESRIRCGRRSALSGSETSFR